MTLQMLAARGKVAALETKRERPSSPRKVALVGLGEMGSRHAKALRAKRQLFDLVATYDPRADADTPPGTARAGTFEEAIRRADVVVLATPTETHARLASVALSRNKAVLVEKPLCATTTEAAALTAHPGSGRLYVGHSERFNPVVRTLKALLRPECVVGLELRRLARPRPGTGEALFDLGVHDFDLAAFLGGGPVEMRGAVGPAGGEDFAHVLLSLGGGGCAHVHVDRTAAANERTIVVYTPEWTYRGDLKNHRLLRIDLGGSEASEMPLSLEDPLEAQAAALADALDGQDVAALASAQSGAQALETAAQAAAAIVEFQPHARGSGVVAKPA